MATSTPTEVDPLGHFSATIVPLTGAVLSVAAFDRDLPLLLNTDPGRWVAYAHGERLRLADSQTELYQYCVNELGLGHEEFVLGCVVPEHGGEVEYTPR